jgi:acyl carrier protein
VTEKQAIELVTRIICHSRQLDPEQVFPGTQLEEDLGFDSLDAAELLAALHKETGRQLQADSIGEMQTVSGVARILVRQPD